MSKPYIYQCRAAPSLLVDQLIYSSISKNSTAAVSTIMRYTNITVSLFGEMNIFHFFVKTISVICFIVSVISPRKSFTLNFFGFRLIGLLDYVSILCNRVISRLDNLPWGRVCTNFRRTNIVDWLPFQSCVILLRSCLPNTPLNVVYRKNPNAQKTAR